MKRALFLICVALVSQSAVAQAVSPPQIGFLGISPLTSPVYAARIESFRTGLRELGYVDGKTIAIHYRSADGDYGRLRGLADELVALKVRVLVTQATDATRAAKAATKSIPIVMVGVSDPVATGLVPDLARPGGNVTGVMYFVQELNQKRLEFLKQVLPQGRKFAALVNPDNTSHPVLLKALGKTAAALGVEVAPYSARSPSEFEAAFDAMVKGEAAGVVIMDDGMFSANVSALGRHATRKRLAAGGITEFADAGGLIGFSANGGEVFRRTARYVDRILKGALPAQMPVERIEAFELVIHKGVAKELGLQLPQPLLLRADRVIE